MTTRRANGTTTDRPTVHATAKKLDAETAEPFVYMTKASHRVVFPDPYGMEWEAAEEFLTKLDNLGSSREALAEWLSEEDFAALKADKLTLREMLGLVQMIQQHYTAFLGSPGEGQASERS